MVGRILRLGIPSALQWTIASVSRLAVAALINQYGVQVSAGNGVSNKIKDFCQLFYAGMFSYNTLANGSGHTVFVMWNSFLNCIVVRLILAVILDHFFGVVGVYAACGIAVSSAVPVEYWFYRSRRWMQPGGAGCAVL